MNFFANFGRGSACTCCYAAGTTFGASVDPASTPKSALFCDSKSEAVVLAAIVLAYSSIESNSISL